MIDRLLLAASLLAGLRRASGCGDGRCRSAGIRLDSRRQLFDGGAR